MEKAIFSINYPMLKEIGKMQYSNEINAICELVANSIDAEANVIRIVITKLSKEEAEIRIMDNGIGMSVDFIESDYVKIGFKKRQNEAYLGKKTMGRKGVGKLAALYLSNNYQIFTKTENCKDWSVWEFMYDKTKQHLIEENPELVNITNSVNQSDFLLYEGNKYKSGTEILMKNVGVNRFGKEKLSYLYKNIIKMFTAEGFKNREITVEFYDNTDSSKNEIKTLSKEYDFNKMIMISYLDPGKKLYERFEKFKTESFKIKAKPENLAKFDVNSDKLLKEVELPKKVKDIAESIKFKESIANGIHDVEAENDNELVNIESKEIKLKGWISIVSSLEKERSEEDKLPFENKIRLYVNNKLAYENILEDIKSTQVFSKYIEGELEFDLLDDNKYVDIATTNRQDFNKDDPRFIWLKNFVNNEVNDLIEFRNKVGNEAKQKNEKNLKEFYSIVKSQINEELQSKYKENLNSDVVMKTLDRYSKGIFWKNEIKVFISHASEDSWYGDFWNGLFLLLGIKQDEIFYTSHPSVTEFESQQNIYEVMREKLMNSKTFVLYLLSDSFVNNTDSTRQKGRTTIFEAGAGWITKYDDKSYLITGEHEMVERFFKPIYNNQFIYNFVKEGNLVNLEENFYNKNVTPAVNYILGHINKNRRMLQINELPLLQKSDMDQKKYKEILDFWKKSKEKRLKDLDFEKK